MVILEVMYHQGSKPEKFELNRFRKKKCAKNIKSVGGNGSV